MTIVRCPRCRDEVTLPPKASAQALVRCPLCLEEYVLNEALAQLPPSLIVVGAQTAFEPALVDDEADRGPAGEYRLAGSGLSTSVFDSGAPASPTAAPMRPALKVAPRPRRKEKSTAAEIIKVILGGVVGLSLGLLVLWWGLGRDDFELGPTVANYAPWIVPAKFHGRMQPTDMPPGVRRVKIKESQVASDSEPPVSTGSDQREEPPQKPDALDQEHTAKKPTIPEQRPQMPDLLDLLPDGPNDAP